ncbi:hypothetical protein GIS00_02670 [Nakamurella sp. YIM 132087]|uniref:Uncharacterized protein n=1 Tax=Nakamurella alba TaxID=2665158 RepID=A0A7K1FFG9_9ACTN|nr:hypothetical protein [Nakamurella alba]MTD12848.1 hypothetical protein [Nakamurella alba]
MVRTLTDAGGADLMHDDASFVLTFGSGTATGVSQCGVHTYGAVTEVDPTSALGDFTLDLGTPSGPDCILGDDPGSLPMGQLSWGWDPQARHYWLSTGYVAWFFAEA